MCRFAPAKIFVAIVLALVTAPSLPAAEDDLPYVAYAVVGDTEVRSGPGDSFYATDRLPLGAEVEVHRRDPGGWLAIRPLAESFCWIPAEKLELTNQPDIAEVVATDAVAWMGSNVQTVNRHRWQVRLEPGERVAILGVDSREETGSRQSRSWYKMAPPAGEFRWVHGDDVRRVPAGRSAARASEQASVTTDRAIGAKPELARKPTQATRPDSVIRKSDAQMTITTRGGASTPAAETRGTSTDWVAAKKNRGGDTVQRANYTVEEPPADEQPALRRRGPSMVLDNVSTVIPAAANEPVEAADSVGSNPPPAATALPTRTDRSSDTRVVWAPKSPRREVQQLDNPLTASLASTANGNARSEVSLERDDLELQLSMMVTRDPQLWNLAALRGRAESLIERSPSALERGQVRLLLEQIEEFEDLHERHVQVEKGIVVPTSATSATTGNVAGRATGSRVEPRFDGSGWLIPVHSVKRSAPPYAMTDDDGKVVMYVTPAPGVNLHRYERKRVGIYGQRNSTQDLSVQVLTAHRVIDIERHTTR